MTLPRLPASGRYILKNLSDISNGFATSEMMTGVADGLFVPASQLRDVPALNAQGWAALPRLTDAHVHLDKTYSLGQTGMGDGTLAGAMEVYTPAAKNWQASHYKARMEAALHAAFASGTGAMRSHVDCMALPNDTPAWQAALELRSHWSGHITLQLSALSALFRAELPGFDLRCAQVAAARGALGLFIPPGPVNRMCLRTAIDMAGKHALPLDFHIDEHLQTGPLALQILAEEILTTGYDGPVLAGHGCALSVAPPCEQHRTIDLLAQANIQIAVLPRTNLYLQDRAQGRTPRLRGLTLMHEMKARGIPVILASDNVQDAYFPFGDYDLLRLLADTTVAAHLDQDLGAWFSSISTNAAGALTGARGTAPAFMAAGSPADMVLVPATDWPGLLMSPPSARIVVSGGHIAAPPEHTGSLKDLAHA